MLTGRCQDQPPHPLRMQPQLEIQQFCSNSSERPGALLVEMQLSNRGTLSAEEVTVTNTLPAGFGLHATTPQAARNRDKVVWSLGTVAPGEVRVLRMILDMQEPMAELRNVVSVLFQVRDQQTWSAPIQQAVVLASVIPPTLARVGASSPIQLTLYNIGNVAAEEVSLSALLPAGLTHPFGQQLHNFLGTLEPGSVRKVTLNVTPARTGPLRCVVRIEGKAIETQTYEVQINAQGPKLSLEPFGSATCALRTRAKCLLTLTCDDEKAVGSIRIVAKLPDGLAFVDAGSQGRYDPQTHTVEWSGIALFGEQPLSLEVVGQVAGEQAVTFTVFDGTQTRTQAIWPLRVVSTDAKAP